MSGTHDGSGTHAERGKQPDEADQAALIGVAGAAGRDRYVGAQINQAEHAVRAQPASAFDGEVYRSVSIRFTATVADHSYSGPGRYNAPGQSALYTAPSLDAVKAEAHNYEALNGKSVSGLDGKSVVRSSFQGELLDLRATPNVSASALSQPFGYQGSMRSVLSKLTGEDAYTLPRALGDVARERNLSGVIAPANDGKANIALFPDHPDRPASGPGRVEAGLKPLDFTQFDANGAVSTGRFNQPHVSVPDGKPNTWSPAGTRENGMPRGADGYAKIVAEDASVHGRAGGERYGALGAGAVSLVEGVAAGHVDGRKVAGDTALGAAAGRAETSLARGFEGMLRPGMVPPNVAGGAAGVEANAAAQAATRPAGLIAGTGAAGVVGAVVGAGVTTWHDADAVKNHKMSAGQATADVAVQAGIGFGAGTAGAAMGAAIGSVVPVAGTAVGAVVGFGVGMGAGYVAQHSETIHAAQKAAGEYLTRNYEKPLQQAWQGIARNVDQVRNTSAAGVNAVETSASGALASVEAAGRRFIGASSGAHEPGAQPGQATPSQPQAQTDLQAAAQRGWRNVSAQASVAGGQDHSKTSELAEAASARTGWQQAAAAAPAAHPAQQNQQQAVVPRR